MENYIRQAVTGGRGYQVGDGPPQSHAQSSRGRPQDRHCSIICHICNVMPVNLQTNDSANSQLRPAHVRKQHACARACVRVRVRTVMRRSPALSRPSALAGLSRTSCM